MEPEDRGKTRGRFGRVTSYDVARLAGVSQPTVSRAFTPGAPITKEKRDRVLAAAKQLRYVPNRVASNLSSARSNMIAVIIGDMNNPFYSEALQVFIEELQTRDKQVLAFCVPEDGDPDDALMQAMGYHTDGIVVTSALMSSEYASLGATLGIPIVMFNRLVESSPIPTVHCNNIAGSALLAQRMLDAGAKRFLVIRGSPQGSTSRERVEGFCRALDAAGILRLNVVELDGGSTYAGAFATIEGYLDQGADLPDAIFAVNDIMAIGVLDALRQRFGKSAPEDLMLAGFDGTRDARYASYEITTMRQPIRAMVRATLGILLGETEYSGPVVIDGRLVPGRTVPGS